MMRAWIPEATEHEAAVRMADVEPPDPAPHEVTVAVHAYSVNRGETLLLERPRPGWRPGKDVAGVVVTPAADDTGPAVGSRVLGHPPAGGWAEQVAVPVADLAVLPHTVDAVTAAALPLAGLTALRMLRQAGSLIGRRLLVTGASGGVGHYVVELAAAAGAHVTAISASPERGERLLALGAREVHPDVPPDGTPYDVVMESIGGPVLQRALARLRPEGLLLWFGQAGRTPVTLDFFEFFAGPVQADIRQFDYTRGDAGFAADLATLVDLVATGRLHPELGLVRRWTETPAAIEALRARRVRGNAVLVVDPTTTPITSTDPQEER
jgi:NADPH:quinone reductase-like Zn-dependent oxidoreductase